MQTKNLHRLTGIVISIFVFAHLFNHAMAWFGIEKHIEIMQFLRKFYRNPIAETLLVLAFGFQVWSGMAQFKKMKKLANLTIFDRLQLYSGLFIAFFIVQHLLAVIGQRLYYQFDTNFYFASRVVLQFPIKLYFIPYYFLGILAFGIHLASIHRKKITRWIAPKQADIHAILIVSVFFVLAMVILYVFMGGKFTIQIPEIYDVY